MGTSTRWKGPAGGGWSTARSTLTRLGNELTGSPPGPTPPAVPEGKNAADDVAHRAGPRLDEVAGRLLEALRLMFKEDPDPLGLNTVIRRDARRLVRVLDSLMSDGIAALVTLKGTTPDERADEFVRAFTDAVSGYGSGLFADAVARRASVHCAVRLLQADESPVAAAVRDGSGSGKITGELLCLVYAFFFADVVSEFLTAAVAEKLKIALPVLYLDPTGEIAKRIAEKIIGLAPNPCEEQQKVVEKDRSLAETAQKLIPGSIADLLVDGR